MKGPESKAAAIPALTPRGRGHQFVLYGDSCSGVPGAPHERTFASVNAVLARLSPAPEFILFPGDEVIGLTGDPAALQAQWRHWLDVEMAWLDRTAIPLYHATSNHTTYDRMSERIFTETLPHLPRNGPSDQKGLSYFIRRDDLLLVFVNTCWSGLGGEGHVETDWLGATLRQHADARHKFVVGHHPVFPINGFSGAYQREIGPEHGPAFWALLVEHSVFTYLCSHILAFDVQVHQGVLQIASAGAGTAHRMPEDTEYLHGVQAALDAEGLRYQVLDVEGRVRERLSWPFALPPRGEWMSLSADVQTAPAWPKPEIVAWRFQGRLTGVGVGQQTLLSAWPEGSALAPLWIGVTGPDHRLSVVIGPTPGRSPHYWFGPCLPADDSFDIELALHGAMGPGGVLWRDTGATGWTSLEGASPWGPERLDWPEFWSVGHGKRGADDRAFAGADLAVSCVSSQFNPSDAP